MRVQREQRSLEEQLQSVLESVNENNKALLQLNDQLLARLSANEGNLLDDEKLIGVLAETKAKAADVKEKLAKATETKVQISEKREQYRPVACRGAVLYFSIVDVINISRMYQTSLVQFLQLFSRAMSEADRAQLASKRVRNIIEKLTYITYRYINRGLFSMHKLPFVLIVALKILQAASIIDIPMISSLLKGGADVDASTIPTKPCSWLSMESWLNVIALSKAFSIFKALPENILRAEGAWKKWYDEEEPETA